MDETKILEASSLWVDLEDESARSILDTVEARRRVTQRMRAAVA